MKISSTLNVATFISVVAFGCFSRCFAQANTKRAEIPPLLRKVSRVGTPSEQKAAKTSQRAKLLRPRADFVKMADFYLKDGKLKFGKLVSEDRNKVIIEELNGSKIVVNAYSRREFDPRTLQTKNVPEYKYYMDLAEHFSGRTWDFKDDPDDFIQAVRCYEKAKQAVVGTSPQDRERIGQANEKIKKLQADRQVWAREVESRAKLKELELESEVQTRLNELEDKINASSQKIDESVRRLDEIIKEIQDNHQRLQQGFSVMDQDIRQQLNILAGQIETNRRIIDPFFMFPRRRYPYGY